MGCVQSLRLKASSPAKAEPRPGSESSFSELGIPAINRAEKATRICREFTLGNRTISRYSARVLLIDILNGLYFGGVDFFPALEAGKKRTKLLNPFLKRILKYAANEPAAYQCRFTESLLDSAAYLLADAGDPDFIDLALPLIDADAEPNLIGFLPEDSSRLLAASLKGRVGSIFPILKERQPSDEFCSSVFEALVLSVHWSPDLQKTVTTTFCALLRADWLADLSSDARYTLVDCCCRLDSRDFLLDLYLAVGQGALDEAATTAAIDEANRRSSATVWLEDWTTKTRMTENDSFLRQHCRTFDSTELHVGDEENAPDPVALSVFNSVAAPARDYVDRIAAICPTPALVDIATRVLRLAANGPEDFLNHHLSTAVLAAICLGSPSGDTAFARQFLLLLSAPDAELDFLLGDDLTELCETALSLAVRFDPDAIRELAENPSACGVCRSLGFGALVLQTRLGNFPRDEMSEYCRALVRRRHELGREVWFWAEVAKVCGELWLGDLQADLKQMVNEDFFRHESGDVWMDANDIEEMFSRPETHDQSPPAAATPLELLRCSSYSHEHQSVRGFLSNLEPPRVETVQGGAAQ